MLRLRFSPQLFAREAPEMFVYDEASNEVKLREGRPPPWIRSSSGQKKTDRKTWLYCPECKDRYCPDGARTSHAHVPYRDKASQFNLRAHRRYDDCVDESSCGTQPEPEAEAEDEPTQGVSDGELPLPLLPHVGVPDLPEPVQMPSLETYKSWWAKRKAHHSRGNQREFSTQNLIPKPISQLVRIHRGTGST